MRKLLLILVGILFVAVGIYLFATGQGLAKRCTEETKGTVVEIKREESTDADGDTSYSYYPVIEYKAGEKTLTKKSNLGTSQSKYRINDKIDIKYNPNKVEEFIIKGDNSSNFMGIAFIVAGAFVTIAGIVKFLRKM